MADKKKKLPEDSADEKLNNLQLPPENENLSMEDKLKAAAGNITKAHAGHRARNSELVKRRIKAEKETAARIAEAEKRKEENERAAQKVADEKIAAFDYAQNYRKKLLKEREAAMSAAKQRAAEEREAAIREAKEAKDQTVAAFLEEERREAKERSERAQALLDSVTKREIIDENGNKVLVDRFPPKNEEGADDGDAAPEQEITAEESGEVAEEVAEIVEAAEAPVEEPVEAAEELEASVEDAPAEEIAAAAEDAVDEETAEAPAEEAEAPANEADEAVADEDAVEDSAPAEEPDDNVLKLEYEPKENKKPDDDDGFEMIFDDDGNLVVRHKASSPSDNKEEPEDVADAEVEESEPGEESGGAERDIPEVTDEDIAAFNARYNQMRDERRKEKKRAKGIDPDAAVPSSADDVLQDEIVTAIKAEGGRLTNVESALKMYIKHSADAIKSFEKALKAAEKQLAANRNDAETPAILASILKIITQILEVKANNLENFARLKANKYIRNARLALRREVDRYNDYVITYSSITGEQLTRLSTLLADSIAQGKSLAVIPSFSYVESYIDLYPDENGKLPDDDGSVCIISPIHTGEELVGEMELPSSRGGCNRFRHKIQAAISKLDDDQQRISKMLWETKQLRKKYEQELRKLDRATSDEERAEAKYKNKVLRISIKYGRKLSGVKTSKARSAFARTRQRLFVTRLATEREKLRLAYSYLREVYREGKYSQKKYAEDFFISAMLSYNKCAESCGRINGTKFYTLEPSVIERICRGDTELSIPVVAYKRELVETVGENSRIISTKPRDDVAPNEVGYAESSSQVLNKNATFKTAETFGDEMPSADRASAVARVVIDALRESGSAVKTVDDLKFFIKKCERAIRFFKKSVNATERAMARAFDDDGVIIALVENLRAISNVIEVRRIFIDTSMKLRRTDYARPHSRSLYKEIELYNGRAIDYMSIVGEQFARITTAAPKDLMNSASSMKIPTITYKDNYIEVFPRDPLKEMSYEKPYQRNRKERTGYTPVLMQHYRLTENRAVEFTVINSPFVFDVTVDKDPVVSWWHPIGLFGRLFVWTQPIVAGFRRLIANTEIWFIDESALLSKSGVENRRRISEKRQKKLEMRLDKLKRKHKQKLLSLETTVHDSDRNSASYQKKLYKLNTRYNRKIYRLKLLYSKDAGVQNSTKLLLEQLVLERERLTGINKLLIKYRNYGRLTFLPNILVKYKRRFLEAINAHNKTAAQLSERLGVPFSEVSTSVADEIIRYGNMIKFPQIVCCREVIETIDGVDRTIGDKWHGYGLYTGTSGSAAADGANAPIMSVGAMGYATDMGVPFLKADFDGMTMLGITPGGVPLLGFNKSGETTIPFTGTPMMLQGTDDSVVIEAGIRGKNGPLLGATDANNPYSGIHSAGVDALYAENADEDAKDLRSGSTTETPLDLEAKLIEERFSKSLRARSMTTVDSAATWWRLLGSEINVRWMRSLFLRREGFLRFLMPKKDEFTEVINDQLQAQDALELERIARLGAIIDIECQRLYSAVKAGIRRSQRVWSAWLHDDIEKYNNLVSEFNNRSAKARKVGKHDDPQPRLRHEWIEPLSLSIPDRILHRLDDRPPTPRVLSLRNKVEIDENSHPITAGGLYETLYRYALVSHHREGGPSLVLYGIPYLLMRLFHWMGLKSPTMAFASMLISARTTGTRFRRVGNEERYYRIRYEKARAMKRYNKRAIKAIGFANNPVKYQRKSHENLRKYVASNFRTDYNMRIRQLIWRALRVDRVVYWVVIAAFCAVIALASLLLAPAPAIQMLLAMGIVWAATPIICILLRSIYFVVLLLVQIVLIFRNIVLINYGTRDIEKNRYGIVLEWFVTEQYKLLSACEVLHRNPKSKSKRRKLLSIINKYNKELDKFSSILRVPISEIEPTALIEKLVCGDEGRELTELQNFVYVRELVEKVDEHDIGDTTRKRELDAMLASLQGEINAIINEINAQNPVASPNVTFLQGAIQRLINFIQSGATPTENDRFELKRDLIGAINRFDITENKKELFSKDVIKIVDSLGTKPKRRIISVLAVDDMIDLKTKNKK